MSVHVRYVVDRITGGSSPPARATWETRPRRRRLAPFTFRELPEAADARGSRGLGGAPRDCANADTDRRRGEGSGHGDTL